MITKPLLHYQFENHPSGCACVHCYSSGHHRGVGLRVVPIHLPERFGRVHQGMAGGVDMRTTPMADTKVGYHSII